MVKSQQKVMEDLERKLKEERERQDRVKEGDIAELRQQLQSVQVSAGRSRAIPTPQVRRKKVMYNDIELWSPLSLAASAYHTYPRTADHLTGWLQIRGMCCLVHSVVLCLLHSQTILVELVVSRYSITAE